MVRTQPFADMTKQRKRRGKKEPPSRARCNAVDDFVAQLQRQRQKQQSNEIAAAAASAATPLAEKDVSVTSSIYQHRNSEPKSAGHFQYDPIRKRYFPKSMFTSGHYDPCAQRIRKPSPVGKATDASTNNIENERVRRLKGSNVSINDVRRIVFRGTCLSRLCNNGECAMQLKGRRRKPRDDTIRACSKPPYNHCSERTSLLLTCSLEYCASIHRRNAMVSKMVSVIVLARRATIIPNMSSLDDIRKEMSRFIHPAAPYFKETSRRKILSYTAWPVESLTNGTRHPGTNTMKSPQWFSILQPLQRREELLRNQQIQLNDSNCKLYLQPTAPTFDFHCGGNDEHPNAMPHIATISNNAIFYRAPSSNAEGCSAWELERKSNHVQYQGVRLVNSTGRPSFDSNNGTTVDAVVVGCVVQDVHMDSHYFTIQNTSPSNIQGRRSLAKECFLRSPVNDFRFAKDGTLNVAFAHGGENSGASIAHISSDSFIASSYRGGLHSEPLCLQFQSKDDNVLLGHRDGSVSMLDFRSSRGVLFAHSSQSSAASSFGSATSVRPLKRDNNLVVVKGSFGTCRLLDIRKLSSNIESYRHRQSTVLDLSLSSQIVHKTKSTRCTGLALDPVESIAVAPFAGPNGEIQLAIWDICSTGRLIRILNLNNSVEKHCTDRHNNAAFCELSDVVTYGFGLVCDKDSEIPFISCNANSWGMWYKTNALAESGCGDIHHIKF